MNRKIVIIGGGVAGLAAGIYGQKNGYTTEIIEMHTVPGGQCTAWERRGYRFDYCLHWLVGTAKGPFHDIWLETDVITDRVTIVDHEVHTRVIDAEGNDFIVYTSIDRWERYLVEFAPEDAAAIRKMCAEMRKATLLEPFREPPELRGFRDYLRVVVKMLPALLLLIKYGKKSCRDYFESLHLGNPRLAFFLDNLYGQRDFSALAFLMMLGWFNQKNAGYLIGGSLPLAGRMAQKYSSLGGTLSLGKRVAKIAVENNAAVGVILSDGTRIEADHVISAADGHATIYEMLGGKYLTGRIEEAYRTWPLFPPLVQVSFGIDRDVPTRFPVQTFLAKGTTIGGTALETGYTVMNYSFDPTMAPPGKTVVVLRYETPWEFWHDLAGEAYTEEKKRIERDAVVILEQHLPEAAGHIEVVDVATPLTDVRHTGVWKGAYEGFMPASRNITQILPLRLPELRNFCMCGQWLAPGGGLPPSAQSGKWAIQLICREDHKEFIC